MAFSRYLPKTVTGSGRPARPEGKTNQARLPPAMSGGHLRGRLLDEITELIDQAAKATAAERPVMEDRAQQLETQLMARLERSVYTLTARRIAEELQKLRNRD